jgi:hypothetical protein
VPAERDPRHGGHREHPPGAADPPAELEAEVLQPDVRVLHELIQLERDECRDRGEPGRHEERRSVVQAAERQDRGDEDGGREQLLGQRQVEVPSPASHEDDRQHRERPGHHDQPGAEGTRRRGENREERRRERRGMEHRSIEHAGRPAADLAGQRRCPEAERQRPLGTHVHAVETLHAARADDHAVTRHLLVDSDVRRARRRAVAALVARVADDDPPQGQAVHPREERPVRTSVRAEPLGPEKPHHGEPARQERQDGDRRTGEGVPEPVGHDVVLEAGEARVRDEQAPHGRPHEHVQPDAQRHEHEQPRAERAGADTELAQRPPAQVLERHDVAGPPAEEAAEQHGRQERDREEDEPGVDPSELERVHRLGRLDRGQGAPCDEKVRDVGRDHHVDRDQDRRTPPAPP